MVSSPGRDPNQKGFSRFTPDRPTKTENVSQIRKLYFDSPITKEEEKIPYL